MSRGMDLNSLIEEAQQMLTSVGEVLTSTMQQGVEVVKDYKELAENKVSEITKDKKKELADLSAYGETVKTCIEKRQTDFNKIEEKLRKELAACYTKNYGNLDNILANKASIHEEAQQIKNELHQEMLNCMSAENKTECFITVLKNIKKRLKMISSRANETLKNEALARAKASKAVYECDKKAMDEAYKKCTSIVNEVKKCTVKEDQNT